jgi:hypothetical protein
MTTVWRYMSLAKYVDLLRSRSLHLPKASQFSDADEGKWIANACLWGQKGRRERLRTYVEHLRGLLDRCGDDLGRLAGEAFAQYEALSPVEKKSVLGDVLGSLDRFPLANRGKVLQSMVESWTKLCDAHGSDVRNWVAQVAVDRECTYVSCWTRAESASLAMWAQYGGGPDSVAIRTRREKLETLVDANRAWLEGEGLRAGVVDVAYVDGLKDPGEELQNDLIRRLTLFDDPRLATFSIKPTLYSDEREVRIIAYSFRDLFDAVADPHPNLAGIALPLARQDADTPDPLIESVHVHPSLDDDSMQVRVVKAINQKFGMTNVPVVVDKIRAFGPRLELEPDGVK